MTVHEPTTYLDGNDVEDVMAARDGLTAMMCPSTV